MDIKCKDNIKYSIRYYFEIKPKFKSLATSCNPNEATYSDTNSCSTSDTLDSSDTIDALDDSYIDEYVNYNLIDVRIYKW